MRVRMCIFLPCMHLTPGRRWAGMWRALLRVSSGRLATTASSPVSLFLSLSILPVLSIYIVPILYLEYFLMAHFVFAGTLSICLLFN